MQRPKKQDKYRREGKGRGSCLGEGILEILHKDDMKKRMNGITATWRNGCFEKMDDHLVHTIPKMFLQKLLFKSSLLLNGECGIQALNVSQTTATTFPFPSVFIFLLGSLSLTYEVVKSQFASSLNSTRIQHITCLIQAQQLQQQLCAWADIS